MIAGAVYCLSFKTCNQLYIRDTKGRLADLFSNAFVPLKWRISPLHWQRHFSCDVYDSNDISVCLASCCYGSNEVRKNSSFSLLEHLIPRKWRSCFVCEMKVIVYDNDNNNNHFEYHWSFLKYQCFHYLQRQRLCVHVFLFVFSETCFSAGMNIPASLPSLYCFMMPPTSCCYRIP